MRELVDHTLAVGALPGQMLSSEPLKQKDTMYISLSRTSPEVGGQFRAVNSSILRDQCSKDPGWWAGSAILNM